MNSEKFYLTDTPLFFAIQAIAYILSITLASITSLFASYQFLTLYLPYLVAKLSGNSFKFPEYFYRVYGDDVTDLQLEHWGYLISAVAVTVATFKFVLPDSPFKSSDSANLFSGAKATVESAFKKFDTVMRVAKKMAAVVADEANKMD
jgi:hypothetical protein